MILWEKSDCSPDWTELLSILADLAKLTEKCCKNCGLLPKNREQIILKQTCLVQKTKAQKTKTVDKTLAKTQNVNRGCRA